MGDIKIPSGPKPGVPVDAASGIEEETGDAAQAASGTETAMSSDAVTRVAEELAAGRITGDQAVERIIAETMGSEMVQQAPEHVREELAAALQNLIEADPHLRSLARGLGATTES
jgi:hypothetical protein